MPWKNNCITLGYLVWTDGHGTPSSPLHSNHPNKTTKSRSFSLKQVPGDTNKQKTLCPFRPHPSGTAFSQFFAKTLWVQDLPMFSCILDARRGWWLQINLIQFKGERVEVGLQGEFWKIDKNPLQGNNEETRSAALVYPIPQSAETLVINKMTSAMSPWKCQGSKNHWKSTGFRLKLTFSRWSQTPTHCFNDDQTAGLLSLMAVQTGFFCSIQQDLAGTTIVKSKFKPTADSKDGNLKARPSKAFKER